MLTPAAGARSWSTATASWATCASTCSTWCAGCSSLGWPKRVTLDGRHSGRQGSKANIPDTQTATFDFGDLTVSLAASHLGRAARSEVPLGRHVLRRQGNAQSRASTGYDFIPLGQGATPIHRDVTYELDQYPEDKTEKDLEKHVAPAIRRHMKDFLAAIATRGKPVADIEQGYISTASCILANLSLQLGGR